MRIPTLFFLLLIAPPLQAQDENAALLQRQGMQLETVDKNYPAAIEKYRASATRAQAAGRNDIAARSLFRLARCHEMMEPPDLTAAQAAYEEIAGTYADQTEFASAAQEKVRLKGVDVLIQRYATLARIWRDAGSSNPTTLTEPRDAIASQILALDRAAIYGLIQGGLSHEDPTASIFAADLLAELVDDEGIGSTINALNSPSAPLRMGAGLALERIAEKYRRAADIDAQAEQVTEEIQVLMTASIEGPLQAERDRLQQHADDLKRAAGEVRRNIPARLSVEQVQAALAAVMRSEAGDAESRRAAARALGAFGGVIAPELAQALQAALSSTDPRTREGAARAAGSVRASDPADRLAIVQRLAGTAGEPGIVAYEPEKDSRPFAERDWANEPAVRAAAAESLGRIGDIRSIPALIRALEDNEASVRMAANAALERITGLDVGYEADSPVSSKVGHLPDRLSRQEAIEKWKTWWNTTAGIDILVQRFHTFASRWTRANAQRLFDREFYLREVRTLSGGADARLQEAQAIIASFQERKDALQQDIFDLGEPAIAQLFPYLGGENLRGATQDSPVVRLFVAECIGRLASVSQDTSTIARLDELLLSGSTPAQRAGAASAFGFIPKDKVTASAREVLEKKGLTHSDVQVRAASAEALSRVGTSQSTPALAAAAESADVGQPEGVRLAVMALRAIGRIGSAESGVVPVVGRLLAGGDGKEKSKNDSVREYAAESLGLIGASEGMEALLKGRRDHAPNVRTAAAASIRSIAGRDAGVRQIAEKVLQDDSRPAEDRRGAALALGDIADAASAEILVYRVVDRSALEGALRDPDPDVRAACGTALSMIRPKNRTLMAALVRALDDEADEVQRTAYAAIQATAGADVAATKKLSITVTKDGASSKQDSEFRPGLLPEERKQFIAEWLKWAEGLPDRT